MSLYPPLEPHRTGRMAVDTLHTLYWEESGNPEGIPVLFLHGGPGSGTSPKHRQFFDAERYRIVLFDQRGARQSTPLGEYRDNTTPLLVQDIEQLREMLGISQWLVFGGSWGSTLALAYGQAHPERCLGFVLRGIFLCSDAEIDWFMQGMGWFFPEEHARFTAPIAQADRGARLLDAYCEQLFSDDPTQNMQAARGWSRYEGSCLHLLQRAEVVDQHSNETEGLAVGRLEAHYFRHKGFMSPGQLLAGVTRIRHLPAVIVQGRYDVVCPTRTAWSLHQAWPEARMVMVEDAGHSAFEPGITAALVAATDRFKTDGTL